MTSKALPMLKMTSLSSSLDTSLERCHNAKKRKLSKSQGLQRLLRNERLQDIPTLSAIDSIIMLCEHSFPDVRVCTKHDKPISNRIRVILKHTLRSFGYKPDAGYLTDAEQPKVQTDNFYFGLGVVPTIEEPINMYCDNIGAIAIAKDHGVTKGARHFRVKVYYLRETIEMGDVKIEKVDTDDNLADPFTKALAFPKHSELTEKIGMIPASSLIGSKFHLVYRLVQPNKKTQSAPRKNTVTNAKYNTAFPTTSNSFDALNNFVDVDYGRDSKAIMEDSDSKFTEVHDDTTRFLASLSNRAGEGANDASLVEDEFYDIYDGYKNGAFDGLTHDQLAFCDAYDIRMMMKVLCVMVAFMMLSAPYTEAISCGQVISSLSPCLAYLRSGGAVSGACCSGVKSINSAARTSADRKTACGCLKSAYSSNRGLNAANAAGLPGKCGVSIPYKISPNTDCSKVQ
ncbi:non-specific lipid-transfer protein-like protein [Tanacetum coccineum]|uniref:Non-specific lipid-transfer protein n=1 Tax=Tanacetum coccineum TaxID=301880 RepID=A0ABQ5B5E2_9ASTR